MPIFDERDITRLRPGDSLGPSTWRSTPGHELTESLEREFLLSRQISGSNVGLPERSFRTGPGWDAWSFVEDGFPSEDPSAPWNTFSGWSPVWVRDVSLVPYDPVWSPLAAGTSGTVRIRSEGRSDGSPSGIRLTTGNSATTTEEAWVERGALGSRLAVFFGNFRSAGRDVIGPLKGQNLLLRMSRSLDRATLRAEYADRYAQSKWSLGRKLRWEERLLRARGAWDGAAIGLFEGGIQWVERLHRWTVEEGATRRRDRGWDGTVAWRRAVSRISHLEGAARVAAMRRTWEVPGGSGTTGDDVGTALALGWRREGATARTRLSVGLESREGAAARVTEPVAAAGQRWNPRGGWTLRIEGSSAVETPSDPTLSNDYAEIIARGAPEGIGSADRDPIRMLRAELGVAWAGWTGPAASDDPGPGDGPATADVSLHRDEMTGRKGAADRPDLWWVEGRLSTPRVFGFWLAVRGTGIVRPEEPLSVLWLPPWTASAALGTTVGFFSGDLVVDGRLTWTGRGEWRTERGTLERDDTVDGELRGRIGEATLFVILRNMEDDLRASSSYDNGWIPRPRRNYAAGLTWNFSN